MKGLLLDNNLPPSLVTWLGARGVEALHIRALGLDQAPDSRIVNEAKKRGWVVATKDVDFRDSALRRGASVILIRSGNLTGARFLAWIEERWEAAARAIASGETLVELV
jgi:predicted nuclease of predicted toxin-antitoxin system